VQQLEPLISSHAAPHHKIPTQIEPFPSISRIPNALQRHSAPAPTPSIPAPLPIKLPPLNINPILPNRHAQILHRQHRPPLPTPLPPAPKPRPLHPQIRRPLPLILLPTCSPSALAPTRRRRLLSRRSGRRRKPRRGAQRADRVIRRRVRRPDAAVLVRVGGDVGDELLRREGEEAREVRGGLGRGWEAGEGEVVVCYGVGDLGGGWSCVSLEACLCLLVGSGRGEGGESGVAGSGEGVRLGRSRPSC